MRPISRVQTGMQNTIRSPEYQYSPLNVKLAQEEEIIPIRLLQLHPIVSGDNNAIGQIVQRRKDQSDEALSYCWEAKSDITEPSYIHILGDNGYSTLTIKPNLAAALRRLRKQGEIRPLWIDAVCIQQADDSEKSEQIPLMSRIYQEAKEVCIWLGEAEQDDEIALAHINRIVELQGFETLIDPLYTDRWAALASLMKREWFSRRWVVQEIAYARKAHVYWGEQSIDWKALADAVALFGSKADKIAELFKQDKKFSNRGDFLGDVEALGANRLVHTIGKVFRKADNGQRIETLLSLEALISNLSAFKSARPHDIIYAILSLAQDARSSAVKPSDTFPFPKVDYPVETNFFQQLSAFGRSLPLPLRRISSAAQTQSHVLNTAMANGKTNTDVHQIGVTDVPTSPVWSNTQLFDAMPDEQDSAFRQMRAKNFGNEAIIAALNRIETHMTCVPEYSDYDTMVEKLRLTFPAVTPIGKKFWDEESWDWSRQGKRGVFALTLKLLYYERELVQYAYEKLLDRTKVKIFHVDYQKKFYEVCRDFIDFTIRSSKSLDMLCRPWAPDNEELPLTDQEESGLPSWICPLSLSPFQPRPDGNFSRVNADLLVGMPDSAGRTYTASAATTPQNWFFGGKDKRNLFVTGLVLDEIEECETEAVEGNVPHSWLKLCGWHDTNNDPPPESFWRTIVADRNERGQNPPSYYQRACKYAFSQRTSRGSLNTDRLINSDRSQVITDYVKRVQAVVWMRKLIRTRYGNQTRQSRPSAAAAANGTYESNTETPTGGFLGLAPAMAKAGDKICLLRGCSVPVVVREVSHREISTADSGTEEQLSQMQRQNVGQKWEMLTCRLIGECYIHSIMDGEAFKIRVDRDLPDYIFEIQ